MLPTHKLNSKQVYANRYPLINAVKHEPNEAKIMKLIMSGANINERDAEGWTPITAAACAGYTGLVRLFAKAGARLPAKDKKACIAIMRAVAANKPVIIEALLQAGASINICNAYGDTPMCTAAFNGYNNIIRLIASNGGAQQANQPDSSGNTPAHYAFITGRLDTMELLSKYGADTTSLNNQGQTPYEMATQILENGLIGPKQSANITEMLKKYPCEEELTPEAAERVFTLCIQNNSDVLRIHLKHGLDPNLADEFGSTLLMTAASYGADRTIAILLEYKADPNRQDRDGSTALMCAMTGNVVLLLLDGGADMELRDKRGYTALTSALLHGNLEGAEILLRRGARVDITDIQGHTIADVIDYAAAYKRNDKNTEVYIKSLKSIRDMLLQKCQPDAMMDR